MHDTFIQGSGSNATDHCNPWSYARYRLPPHFTRQDVSDIATSLDIAIPHAKNDSQCDAKTAVKRLILGLSREQRSERLYEALVLLYQKGVRIESDSSLMQVNKVASFSRSLWKCLIYIYYI